MGWGPARVEVEVMAQEDLDQVGEAAEVGLAMVVEVVAGLGLVAVAVVATVAASATCIPT